MIFPFKSCLIYLWNMSNYINSMWIIILCSHLPSQLRNLELIFFLWSQTNAHDRSSSKTNLFHENFFTLPSSSCDEIEKMMNSFLSRHSNSQNKGIIGSYAWDKFFMHKTDWGKNLSRFNLAMVGKHGWHLAYHVLYPNFLSMGALEMEVFHF